MLLRGIGETLRTSLGEWFFDVRHGPPTALHGMGTGAGTGLILAAVGAGTGAGTGLPRD